MPPFTFGIYLKFPWHFWGLEHSRLVFSHQKNGAEFHQKKSQPTNEISSFGGLKNPPIFSDTKPPEHQEAPPTTPPSTHQFSSWFFPAKSWKIKVTFSIFCIDPFTSNKGETMRS